MKLFAKFRLDMDKMVSIKGLVIRTTPVIPDMKTGKFLSNSINSEIVLTNLSSILPLPGL